MVAQTFNPGAGEASPLSVRTAQAFCLEGPLSSIYKTRQSYRAGFLDLATVLAPSTYLSRTLTRSSGHSLGGPGASSSLSRPVAKIQLKAKRPLHRRANRAMPERRVRLRTPTCCPRHCRTASRLNQDPGCLRSRLRLGSCRRSGRIVGKRKTPETARAPGLLFSCQAATPVTPRRGGGLRAARLRQRSERPSEGLRRARRGL